MSSEKNSELSEYSELTSEKNSEFRIKVGNYHPYSENIVRFGNYSKFRTSFGNFFRTISGKNPQTTFVKKFQNYIRTKILYKFFYTEISIKSEKVDLCLTMKSFNIIYFLFYFNSSKKKQCPLSL